MSFYGRSAVQSISRNPLMAAASAVAVCCSLIVVGVTLIISYNVAHITASMQDSMTLNVFLENNLTAEETSRVKESITAVNLGRVSYVSRSEALVRARAMFRESPELFTGMTEENHPFPASFEVYPMYASIDYIDSLKSGLAQIPGVREVKYGREQYEALLKISGFVTGLSWCVVGLLSLISVALIFNTVKITVTRRGSDISIMKYIGASDSFIRSPFVLEGIILGFGGQLAAVLVIRGLYYLVTGYLQYFFMYMPSGASLAPVGSVMWRIAAAFAAYGTLIGALSSALSIKRHLKV